MERTQNNYAEGKKPHKDCIVPFTQSSENGRSYTVTAEKWWPRKGIQRGEERGMWKLLEAIDIYVHPFNWSDDFRGINTCQNLSICVF